MLCAGDVLRNRYEVIKTIGKGGMSVVYQAQDQFSHNLLAIKDVERTGRDDNQVVEQSLVGEGKMLKQLSNPHLPKIYDIIEDEKNFMLVMDYIEGESLDKLIAREGAQPAERVIDWGMQICEVFHYLHNQPVPIIYRDMKPANVIMRSDGHLMMIDFGTARTQKLGVTMQADTICIGTAGFAAPEQFGGAGQSDARTDIFCLGATLYNMITGHSPCDPPVGILPLEYWNPALAKTPIAEIIYKCTRNDPDERYQTAMEVYEDLHLASVGAFKDASKKGKSGTLGGFRKAEWQKPEFRGSGMITAGLSGLLKREKNTQENTKKGISGTLRSNSGWYEAPHIAEHQPNTVSENTRTPEAVPQEPAQDTTWKKMMIASAILAIVFVVLSVVLMAFSAIAVSVVFLIIALGAAALMVTALIMHGKTE